MEEGAFRTLVDGYLSSIRAIRQVPRTLPEATLYAPLDSLINGFLEGEGLRTRAVQQARTEFGIPDFVIDEGGALGYVEAKKPTTDLDALSVRDRAQQEGLLRLPNVLYTNYREFRLFEDGELAGVISLGGLDLFDHRNPESPSPERVWQLHQLLRRFVSHRIEPPRSADELARALARSTGVLRHAALASLKAAPEGAVSTLRSEWKTLLFEELTDDEFADAYAQTVAYGLLTARLSTTGALTVHSAQAQLERRHPFLAAALRLLTHPLTESEVGWAVRVVLETLEGVGLETFRRSRHPDDPLLYFYEDFLAQYDAELRHRRGVYYTPASVVGFQVRAVSGLLDRLGRPRLLADDVVALDPAAGTGTYLLALLDETIARVREGQGSLAVPAAAAKAAARLHGFEILVGPYTVAHQRLGARVDQLGAVGQPMKVFLADTLAAPHTLTIPQLNLFERQLGEERDRADEVKRDAGVMVVLGNPPYDRAKGRRRDDWLQQKMSLFTGPVRKQARVNLKNLADPYVHFFRWALWKLFESPPPFGPRLLSFITNRSYLGGDAFEGLRLAFRHRFDEIWVVDLGGESRGATGDDNVFDIRVGVAIIVALRRDAATALEQEPLVHYVRVTGTRADKERALKAGLHELEWTEVHRPAGEPFLPGLPSTWRRWPAIDELMPLRQSGVQTKRDKLVVGVTAQELVGRLRAFADPATTEEERRRIFHETVARSCPTDPVIDIRCVRRYGYRPLDVRWLYDDQRFIDRPRPKLHKYWHDGQRAFVTLPKGHGPGPAVFLQTELPDLHAFRGSFGGHVFPLWLDASHSEPNLAPGLLARLRSHLRAEVGAEDVFAFVYGVLSAPSYQPRFVDELAQDFPRIPVPADAAAFWRVVEFGRKIFLAHELPAASGSARLTGTPGPLLARPWWEDGRLRVCLSGSVEPVSEAAWRYSVSGYQVIERWVSSRAGLDLARDFDLVDQLHRVVDSVEASVRLGPRLDAALLAVLEGDTLGTRALLAIDSRAASEELAGSAGALGDAAREADAWAALSDEALLATENG